MDTQREERIFVGISNASGDVALCTILLAAVKAAHPRSVLTVATAKGNAVLLERCRWVDRVLPLAINRSTMLTLDAFHQACPPAEYDLYLIPQIQQHGGPEMLRTHTLLGAQFALAGVPLPETPQRIQLEPTAEDAATAAPFLEQMGDLSTAVLVNLRSYSIRSMYPQYEALLCAGLVALGLRPFVVAGPTEPSPPGVPTIFPPYGPWLHVITQVPALLGIRNGLCDVSASLARQMVVAYSDHPRDAADVRAARFGAMRIAGNITELDRDHPLPLLQAAAEIYGIDAARAAAVLRETARACWWLDRYDAARKGISRLKRRLKGKPV
jgi:hypothetical protein